MSRDELVADAKRAVEIAREALEDDAAEARMRGRGSPAPDTASVSMLATGILIAEAIGGASAEQKSAIPARARPKRAQASRPAA
jgi:hypothetical protein